MARAQPLFRTSHDSHTSYPSRRVSYSQSASVHRRSLSANSDLSDVSLSDMMYDVPPISTPNEDPSVFPDVEKRTKEGFLDYRTSSQRPYKRRYFVLTRNFLLGAANADAHKLDKVIHLENATKVGLVDTSPNELFIHVQQHNKMKKLSFRTDSEDEAQIWLTHIRAATRLTIHDIYHFVEPIGVSDSGTRVWRARVLPSFERCRPSKGDLQEEFVAIKMIEKRQIDQSTLRNEIITMKRLDHPCVVKLHDVFEDKQYLCLIMEYCAGGELYDVVASQQGGRNEAESCDVMHQIARGVRYLHSRSVVHRDLKPENILCLAHTGRIAVKIADFGISKAVGVDGYGSMQTPVGTLTYTAPEILRGEVYDKTCDYWSLGVIMHALLVGYSPWWRARTPTEIQNMIVRGQIDLDMEDWTHVSPEVQSLVLRLLNANPRERATVDDILNLTWREMVSASSFIRATRKLKTTATNAKRRRASTEAFERSTEMLRRLYHVRGQSGEEVDLIGSLNTWDLEERQNSVEPGEDSILLSRELSGTIVESPRDFSNADVSPPHTPRDFSTLEFEEDDGYVSPLEAPC